MITGNFFFSNLSSRQQYFLNYIFEKKIRQKWLNRKSNFVLTKTKPPRAQVCRYFRYKSPKNKI